MRLASSTAADTSDSVAGTGRVSNGSCPVVRTAAGSASMTANVASMSSSRPSTAGTASACMWRMTTEALVGAMDSSGASAISVGRAALASKPQTGGVSNQAARSTGIARRLSTERPFCAASSTVACTSRVMPRAPGATGHVNSPFCRTTVCSSQRVSSTAAASSVDRPPMGTPRAVTPGMIRPRA